MLSEHSRGRATGVWAIPGWLAFMVVALALAGGYVVDDAFVVFRVSERFAAGEGWAFQGRAPADGVTSPLWGLALAALAPLGSTPLVARVVGSVCLLAGGALALHGARGPARAYAAVFLAAQLPMVVWAGAGLETGVATLVVALITCGLALAPAPGGQGSAAGAARGGAAPTLALTVRVAALASLAWVRPELVPLGVVVAWLLPVAGSRRRQRTRRAGRALAVVLGTVAVVVWRLVMFGHALPLAALAKPSDPAHGAQYVALALLSSGALTALLGVLLVHGARSRRWPGLAAFGPARLRAAVAVGLLTVVFAGGDWMPAARLLVPILPLVAVCVGGALASLPRRRAVVTALTLALPVATGLAALPELRSQPAARERGATAVLEALAGAERVALVDIGYLGYAGRFQVVDLGAITDLEVARLPGGHLQKRIPEALLLSRGVDAIVLHSSAPPRVGEPGTPQAGRLLAFAGYPVEALVARMPFVREQFRVAALVAYTPRYHYVVLRRRP